MSRLDPAAVRRVLTEPTKTKLDLLEAFTSIASTNTYLLSQKAPAPGRFRVAVADHQTSGRGRHSRRWASPPGSGLYLSLAYTFAKVPERLPALTLALGVGVAAALSVLGIGGVQLKWPNDIIANDGKLGGILTEAQSGAGTGVTVVTGVGLNVKLPAQGDIGADAGWSQRAVDLRSVADELPAGDVLAGTVVEHVFGACVRFEALGFADFVDDWTRLDWLRGREVTVDITDRRAVGIAAGLDADGALLVDQGGEAVRVISGSIVSVGPGREA